jgi:hypothetical protein
MSRLDQCHYQVVRALEKDGWTIHDLPARFQIPDRTIYVDIEASRQTNGTHEQIMLAEVKCFPDIDSTTRELYIAVGQYMIYRSVLKRANVKIPLYLAIPEPIYTLVFDDSVHDMISEAKIKVVVVDLLEEVVRQWIE